MPSDPSAPAAPPSLAETLPAELFRADQLPALFWASTPHSYGAVYAATTTSAALGTLQMACASLGKPLSRPFGRPTPPGR